MSLYLRYCDCIKMIWYYMKCCDYMYTWDVILYRDVKYCDCNEIWDAVILFEMSDIVTVLWDMVDLICYLGYCFCIEILCSHLKCKGIKDVGTW